MRSNCAALAGRAAGRQGSVSLGTPQWGVTQLGSWVWEQGQSPHTPGLTVRSVETPMLAPPDFG